MYKNEQGMPSVALLGEKKTTERNGVMVKMPVNSYDFPKFAEKAASVYEWYDVKPKIVGNTITLQNNKNDVVFSGKDWKILRANSWKSRSYDSNRSIALMGRVAYPINSSALGKLSAAETALLQMPLILSFNIGDLEVAASREAIGYDPRTQDNIKSMLRKVITEL